MTPTDALIEKMARHMPMSWLRIPLWWGMLKIKSSNRLMFSERYGYMPTLVIGPVAIVWVRYRAAYEAEHEETKG